MNPQADPAATPVPIHDITGPIAFFPYPIWVVAAVAAALLALIALAVWFFVFRPKSARLLTPAEKALAVLARLRAGAETCDPYPFSIEVSDVLRGYLRDEYGLSATTQTSREFLETLRTRNVFNDEEREALSRFLEKSDLIKFARMHATSADCVELIESADKLVRSRTLTPVEAVKR
ncbi:MAG TPA: DUF4381 family protein [Chthoniobacterales bacterium]|nr:DUF4381 family protein [Chthoniobacterales bacterium]